MGLQPQGEPEESKFRNLAPMFEFYCAVSLFHQDRTFFFTLLCYPFMIFELESIEAQKVKLSFLLCLSCVPYFPGNVYPFENI